MAYRRTALGVAAVTGLAACLLLISGCGGPGMPGASPTAVDPGVGAFDSATVAAALRVTGDPASAAGATWTYRATSGGVAYDLQGILRKPAGSGPFPAVIVSHGAGGNAASYASAVAREMVRWGLVVIATNYTHAGGVPLGAPGTAAEPGASRANVLRAQKLLELLRALGYVDMGRVAAHGHSMGAFVTAALVGASPGAFRVASHTAGGVRPAGGPGDAAAPVDSQVAGVRAPYQLHHGDADAVVALALDQRLAAALAARGVEHELVVYAGASHADVAQSPAMLERVRAWYAGHGMF
jgi:dienelactone hydrolase